jgi:hypothetical protein
MPILPNGGGGYQIGTGSASEARLIVRVVTNLMLSATTGTAGNYGVVLKKPIVIIPVAAAGMGVTYSFVMKSGGPFDLGVDSDAHLSMDWQAGTTTAPEVNIDMLFVEQ